jgi:hypothetical protein
VIVFERDAHFDSKFLDTFMKLLEVDLRLTTEYHTENADETERVNQTLEQYLRNYSSYLQGDWVNLKQVY